MIRVKPHISRQFFELYFKFSFTFLNIENAPLTYDYIRTYFNLIIHSVIGSITDIDEIKLLPSVFEKYNEDYNKYIAESENFKEIDEVLVSVLQGYEDDLIRDRKNEVKSHDDVDDIYEEIDEIEYEVKSIIFPDVLFTTVYDREVNYGFWDEQIQENFENSMSEPDFDSFNQDYMENWVAKKNDEKAIDDLFERLD